MQGAALPSSLQQLECTRFSRPGSSTLISKVREVNCAVIEREASFPCRRLECKHGREVHVIVRHTKAKNRLPSGLGSSKSHRAFLTLADSISTTLLHHWTRRISSRTSPSVKRLPATKPWRPHEPLEPFKWSWAYVLGILANSDSCRSHRAWLTWSTCSYNGSLML